MKTKRSVTILLTLLSLFTLRADAQTTVAPVVTPPPAAFVVPTHNSSLGITVYRPQQQTYRSTGIGQYPNINPQPWNHPVPTYTTPSFAPPAVNFGASQPWGNTTQPWNHPNEPQPYYSSNNPPIYYDNDRIRNGQHYGDLPGTSHHNCFNGYVNLYTPGYTVFAPFGGYNTSSYISTEYILTTPYIYANGQEVSVVAPSTDGETYADSDRDRQMRAALNDISDFWEENSVRSLRRRLSSESPVAIYRSERYAYSLRSTEFIDLAQDALDRAGTLSFRFNRIVRRSDGLINAYAAHRYRLRNGDGSDTGVAQTSTVRCTLIYQKGDWYLSAFSLTPDLSR